MIAFREPHSVLLQFDAADASAAAIDAAVSLLSTHFATGNYSRNRHRSHPDARRVAAVIRNAADIDDVLRRVSPDLDLDVDDSACASTASTASVAASAASTCAATTSLAASASSNFDWIADLAAHLVRRDAPDRSFRAPHIVAALRNAFDRRLFEHRRVVSNDSVDVWLRAQTRIDQAFVDRLNRAVQRESAGRCALQLMPHWRAWSPELSDSVLLRLAVCAEVALIELSPNAGAQLAVTSTLVIEPAAAALGDEPITVNIFVDHMPTSPSAAASAAASTSKSGKKKKSKKRSDADAAAAASESKGRTCSVQ